MADDQEHNAIIEELLAEIKELRFQVAELKKGTEITSEGNAVKSFLNNAPIPYHSVDKADNIVNVNEAWEQLFGFSKTEVVGTKLTNYLSPSSVAVYKAKFSDAKQNESVKNLELEFIDKSGGKVSVSLDGKIQQNFDSQSLICNCFLSDISGRKKIENELIMAKEKAQESDRLKSAFLANLSHEIRTPMNGILGFTRLLQKPKLNEEKRDSYVELIQNSGNYLLSIINDIIEISKIETGQIKPHYTEVDVNVMLHELSEVIKLGISSDKNLKFEILRPNIRIDKILTDEVKLRQVLTNLLTNAVKYTDEGKVNSWYEQKDDKIIFHIEDTGAGIAKENHEIIFDRFRRVDESITSKKRGSGLGLAISKAYIEMLGGTISLKSEVGKGSVFSFELPFILPKMEVKSNEENRQDEFISIAGRRTVLVAEDDDVNYLYFEEILTNERYQLIRAYNGKEAVDICRSNDDIQLALMDLKMPVMNGFEAYQKIREIKPELPVIAQTAYSLADDIKKINDEGFTGYITKPIAERDLLKLIDDALRRR